MTQAGTGGAILYPQALPQPDASSVEALFAANHWTGAWTGGIYDFDHYHRTTHEVLGCISGTALVQFGGPDGAAVEFQRGDAVVIPAGIAHRCLKASADFAVVGAYPGGAVPDLNRGPGAILNLPCPKADPVLGPGRGFSA